MLFTLVASMSDSDDDIDDSFCAWDLDLNSTSDASACPQYFHHFPLLPIELRLLIWEYSLPSPRIIDPYYKHHEPWPRIIPNPAILSVSREAREVALKHYTWIGPDGIPEELITPTNADITEWQFSDSAGKWMGVGSDGVLVEDEMAVKAGYYFDTSRDILFFGNTANYTIYNETSTHRAKDFAFNCPAGWEIRNICISRDLLQQYVDEVGNWWDCPHIAFKDWRESPFKGLEKMYFLPVGVDERRFNGMGAMYQPRKGLRVEDLEIAIRLDMLTVKDKTKEGGYKRKDDPCVLCGVKGKTREQVAEQWLA